MVDDGSTNGTPDLVKPPVRLLTTGGRKGAGAARNVRARAAAGEVLFFTDADVVAPPDWIEKALKARAEKGVPCGGEYAGPVKEILHPAVCARRAGVAAAASSRIRGDAGVEQSLVRARVVSR